MHYNKEVLSAVLREMEQEHLTRTETLAKRRNKIYSLIPRIQEIDRLLSKTATSVLYAALESGQDPSHAIEKIQYKNLQLQKERRSLLIQHNFPEDYLDDIPFCSKCNDTGYIGSTPCECLKRKYSAKLTKTLSTMLPIQNQNFESFQLSYYSTVVDGRFGISPYENMQVNLHFCMKYASSFSLNSKNLLLGGSTGLGKTFLSSCIAKVVSEHGFSVAYDTAIRIFNSYESVKFSNSDINESMKRIKQYEQCDLLIIDDLGTEMITTFTTSAFYGLLANRLICHRPIIINTNLPPNEFEYRYSPAIASRLNGEFEFLRFFGNDIRTMRK